MVRRLFCFGTSVCVDQAVADTGKAVVSKPSKVADVQESEEGEESAEYESEYEDEEDEEDDEEDGEEYYSEVDEKG